MAYDQESLDTDIVILSDPDSDIYCDGEPPTPALHSEILPVYQHRSVNAQPASHHALSYAYKDLKRRFNDLESKYKHLTRYVKSDQNSSPAMASHYHSSGASRDSSTHNSQLNDLREANGDLLQSKYHQIVIERDDLKQQLEEWKLKYEELDHRYAMNIQKETQMSEIWQRIHGRSAPSSTMERLQLSQLSQENDSLSQKLRKTEQLLREQAEENSHLSQSIKQMEDQASIVSKEQDDTFIKIERLNTCHQRYESLNQELDQLRSDLRKQMKLGMKDGSVEDKYLQTMGVAVAEGRQETIRLKKMVGDQQEIIRLLLRRQQTNKGTSLPSGRPDQKDMYTASGISRMWPAIGARPKLRQSDLEVDGQPLQCTDDSFNGHSEVVTTADAASKHAILPSTNSKRHTVSCMDLGMEGLLSSDEMNPSPSPSRAGPLVSRSLSRDGSSAQARENSQGKPGEPAVASHISRLGHGKQRWSADDAMKDHEARHDYDDLRFGLTSDSAQRSDVLDRPLRDPVKRGDSVAYDSPQNNSEDLDLYGNSGTGLNAGSSRAGHQGSLGPSSSGTHTMETVGKQMPPAGGHEVENRFRPISSGSQPRPLNIERNDCDSLGSQARSYDNTIQNVNLNTGASSKYQEESSSVTRPTYLNNDPLIGHKTIPNRNIYMGELQDDTLVVAPRPVVVVADGSDEPRNCPVCNEVFPDTVPMGQFQQHVLDCVGPPSPPQEERSCPVCGTVFPEVVAQADFEAHVNNHFEDPLRFEIIDP